MKKSARLTLGTMAAGAILLLGACGEGGDNGDNGDNAENGDNGETAQEGNGEASDFPQLNGEVAEDEQEVVMRTSMGDIHLKLFPERAPKTVENFVTLAEDGYYEGIIFHRVLDDFMIQGGDPTGTGTGGDSIYDGPFEDEFDEELVHLRGALSMANSGPDSNSSQFFIVQADSLVPELEEQLDELVENGEYDEELAEAYKEHGGTPHLDNGHSVFGHVIDGMDVVDEIAAVDVDPQGRPDEDVVIEEIEVID
ncbi:peptidylprolyl isomerase [Alteribacter lacisalsi]|uniref:Peptidyl-prolyl cis-trans isomerase n=1 Tax=Alteribacter lacisalsi TaxID=2045244 RepID=A0A2W0HWP7_9BACI|nr:peptidylprolyl isomerase [Alteribacter lacisalsi]PYZ98158.1 peptidylprolyl isomerase [Alteribacter lacisalsi]